MRECFLFIKYFSEITRMCVNVPFNPRKGQTQFVWNATKGIPILATVESDECLPTSWDEVRYRYFVYGVRDLLTAAIIISKK